MRRIAILWIAALLSSSSQVTASAAGDIQKKTACFESLVGKVRAHVLPAADPRYYASVEGDRVFFYVVTGKGEALDLTRYDMDLTHCRVVEDMPHRLKLAALTKSAARAPAATVCPFNSAYPKSQGFEYFGHAKTATWDYLFGVRESKAEAKSELGVLYRVLHAETKTCSENQQAFFELTKFAEPLTLRCITEESCSVGPT